MMFSNLQKIAPNDQLDLREDAQISYLVTDSRQVSQAQEGTLFFAINGQNHDGHEHIPALYDLGVRYFVVEKSIDTSQYPAASFLYTKDSVKVLQAISAHHRELFNIPIVAITGSNGKTIVKEWLYYLISPDKNVVKSPKSYNSQIGVPLSVWQINANHELGIFEAGISTTGEMDSLEQIIKPSLGIFTNIGSAHDEGFSNQTEKIHEKLKLFPSCEVLVYCKDHDDLDRQITSSHLNTLSWSFENGADIKVEVEKVDQSQSRLTIYYKGKSFQCLLGFTDRASLENAMHCIATMLYLGYAANEINTRFANLPTVKMRLELKPGINGSQIIDDTYNNDLAGLEIALGFLSQQSSLSRTLILSDILQSGLDEDDLYQKVAELIKTYNITKFIGVGKKFQKHKDLFSGDIMMFEHTDEFLEKMNLSGFNKEAILIKGARPFQFEKIAAKLNQKIHGTVLEIDLNALTHNLNFYKSKLSSDTKLMVMVKAMAYGTGSSEIAHLLAHHKVDYLGVAYVDEGVALRKSGITTPIMVMNTSPDGFENIIEYQLEPEIYNFELLNDFIKFLDGKQASIHLKIDTGMKRLGFSNADVNNLIALLRSALNLEVKSLFSHLAGSDEAIHNNFSKNQADTLSKVYDKISDALDLKPMKHILNSSGILRFPAYHFDMVRLGIGLYGIDSNQAFQDQLLPISVLKTTISQTNKVKKGETVGYGRKGKANQDLTIATIAIGYADGFNRAFSNGIGEVILNGQVVPVIGNVCMDMTMIDITGIEASVGDEVVIFGQQMPITTLANKLNTITYEILTNVSERVKRVYFQD